MRAQKKVFVIFLPFVEIMVADHGTCDHDLKEEIEILVNLLLSLSVIVFMMMKLPAILLIKAGKTSQKVKYQHQKFNNIQKHINI